MNIEAQIARLHALPKKFVVVTTYENGTVRQMEVATYRQAEGYAYGQRAKIGRSLISRVDGSVTRVRSVEIKRLPS